jgi:hypothetical protein
LDLATGKIHAKKKSAAQSRKTQYSKSHKSHQNHTIFNQNHTRIDQNHIKTILLFNTFRQNFSLFAFLRSRSQTQNQRIAAKRNIQNLTKVTNSRPLLTKTLPELIQTIPKLYDSIKNCRNLSEFHGKTQKTTFFT